VERWGEKGLKRGKKRFEPIQSYPSGGTKTGQKGRRTLFLDPSKCHGQKTFGESSKENQKWGGRRSLPGKHQTSNQNKNHFHKIDDVGGRN